MSPQNQSYSLLNQTYQVKEPFLWVHIALLAAVPFTMVLCMMGLAVGDPILPGWLEMLILGLPPIALPIWLQWSKPFSPFSLWVVAKPADRLSENQRRMLTTLKSITTTWIAVVAGVFLYVIFRQIYLAAPLAADIAPFPPLLRVLGIIWALVFLLVSSLLWQAGVSAARLLLTRTSQLNSISPYPVEQINADFLVLGKRSPQLLDLEFAPEASSKIQQVKAELVVTADTERDLTIENQAEPSLELLEEFQEQLTKSIIPTEGLTLEDEAEFLLDNEQATTKPELTQAVAEVVDSISSLETPQIDFPQQTEAVGADSLTATIDLDSSQSELGEPPLVEKLEPLESFITEDLQADSPEQTNLVETEIPLGMSEFSENEPPTEPTNDLDVEKSIEILISTSEQEDGLPAEPTDDLNTEKNSESALNPSSNVENNSPRD